MKKLVLAMSIILLLSSCTAEGIYRTAADVSDAGKAYLNEKIIIRQEYRAKQRDTVDAAYKAEMRAADLAERDDDIKAAKDHWRAAWKILEEFMPTLKSAKEKVHNFFKDEG